MEKAQNLKVVILMTVTTTFVIGVFPNYAHYKLADISAGIWRRRKNMKKQVNNINWTVGVQSHAEIMCDMNKKKI